MQETNIEQTKYHENIPCAQGTTRQHTTNRGNNAECLHLTPLIHYTAIIGELGILVNQNTGALSR